MPSESKVNTTLPALPAKHFQLIGPKKMYPAELGSSLDFAKVPAREKAEVLAAFAAHKDEVTAGYKEK